MEKSKKNLLVQLFLTCFYISAFTFGGGFVIVTFMKKKFVDEYQWIDDAEMLDLTVLAQSCPGPIAVNAAILVGWRVAGFAGMLVGVIGTILPPMLILTVISFFYEVFRDNRYVALLLKGMQSGVAAVICDVVLGLGSKVVKQKSILKDLIMICAFVASFFLQVNVIGIIFTCGLVGLASSLVHKKEGGA